MIGKLDTLILDGRAVKSLVSIDDVIREVKVTFIEKSMGRVQMPSKPYLYFGEYDGDLRVMPAYMEGMNIAAVKIVNSHTKNEDRGLPNVMGIITVIDPETGAPLCIMDGTYITTLRTAAASAVATDVLAKQDSTTLGIIGTGSQAESQIIAISKVRHIEKVMVSSGTIEMAGDFAERIGRSLRGVSMSSATIEDTVRGSDILITVTPSRSPIVIDEWVNNGIHINAVGADAPGKEELDPLILKRSKIIIDDWEQSSHGGEINVPLEKELLRREQIHGELGDVLTGKIDSRTSDDEITIFDSTGLAIQDVATASIVYGKALEKGIGSNCQFID